MILVSCRRDVTSDRRFGDANRIRDYTRATSLDTFDELDEAALLARAEGRHALVLVHGYRNPLRNLMDAYRGLSRQLTTRGLLSETPDVPATQYGLVVGFAWPGFTTRTLGFLAARPWANRAGGFLRALVGTLRRAARTVDVQTHSLGARVALQALSTDDSLWVDNLMLTAPAVDNECLQPREEFHTALDSCNRVFVYHSRRDPVLKTYTLAAFDRALGATGPQDRRVTLRDCPNVHVIDCQAVVRGHGDYRRKAAYYDHWVRILDHAPIERFESL